MAEKEEIGKLKKLSPEERIAKLKKLQAEDKEEIAEAQKMIQESEEQLAKEEEVKDIPIPQVRAVDIGALFAPEEKELFKAKRFIEEKRPAEEVKAVKKREETLEEVAAVEGPRRLPEEIVEEQRQYQARVEELSRRPAEEIRDRMQDIYATARERGYVTPDQMQEVRDMKYATMEKFDDTTAGEYLPSKQAANEMVLTQRMANWLQRMYRA
jgi:hypothetical protein